MSDQTQHQMPQSEAPADAPDFAVVWTEIPVSDLDAGIAFYSRVLDTAMESVDGGPNTIAIFPSKKTDIGGHIYPGKPAAAGTGPTIHLFAGRLEPAMERCSEAGGTVQGQIVEMPFGRFCYATDPDGNSIGLFEPA